MIGAAGATTTRHERCSAMCFYCANDCESPYAAANNGIFIFIFSSRSVGFIISIATAQSHAAHTRYDENSTEIIMIMFASMCDKLTNHTCITTNHACYELRAYFNVKTPFI